METATKPRRHIYYGWIMLLALAIAQPTSWGIAYYSFSVMLKPMQQDTGWSTAALTGAFSLSRQGQRQFDDAHWGFSDAGKANLST
jgi:hypothetical protein